MSSLDVLPDRVRASRVFRRNKVALEVKVLAALIYFSGLSYREVSSLGGLYYKAVRLWYNALKDVLPKPERRYRRLIAVDENKSKLGGEQAYIWAARDIETKEIVAIGLA